MSHRLLTLTVSIFLSALTLVIVAGCEQPIGPDEKYHRKVVAWPLFDVEKWEGEKPDGTTWEKEKGDACAFLQTWEKEYHYSPDGQRIYRYEKEGFFPIFNKETKETPEFKHKKGSVLLFPFESYRQK